LQEDVFKILITDMDELKQRLCLEGGALGVLGVHFQSFPVSYA